MEDQDLPKPLSSVGGVPIINYIIKGLLNAGITQIGVNTFHKADLLENHLHQLTKSEFNELKFNVLRENELSGTAGAIKKFQSFLIDEDDFLVIAGDILTDFDFRKLRDFHQQNDAFCTFAYHLRKNSNSLLELEKGDSGRVSLFYERPPHDVLKKHPIQKVNSSIYCFSSEILKHIPENSFYDIPKDLFPTLLSMKKLYALPISGYRCAIDNQQRLNEANQDLIQGKFKRI